MRLLSLSGLVLILLMPPGAAQWMTGGNTAATQEMIVEVDSAQAAVIREKLQIAKFLGKLLVESAGVLGKIEIGLLTGDMALVETALHGSETHRKIFDMCAEVLVQTMKDYEGGSPGQQGYITGRIVFEAGSFLLPFTKAGTLMQATKSQMLTRLLQRVGPGLKNGAQGVATATKAAVDASQMCFVAGTPVLTQSGLMRIEDIRPGMWVWSRDEHSGAVAWKRVRHTFITHPTELYRLTYELRGPPESGPPSPRTESETLGVTAPHPFWVSNREQPAFIEAEQLQAGDELLTADGRRAVVMSKVLEQAPKGRTFTTYNFEVEDYHTYFAGRNAVWVHNLNRSAPACERALAVYRHFRSKGKSPWDAFMDLEHQLKKASSQTLHKAASECMAEILALNQKLPSYKQMAKVNGGHYVSWKSLGSRADDVFKDVLGEIDVQDASKQWFRIKLEVHHGVPKAIQKFFGIPENAWDDTPAFLTTMMNHRVGLESLHGRMTAKGIDLKNLSAWRGRKSDLLEAMRDAYSEAEIPDLWNQCASFLSTHNIQ